MCLLSQQKIDSVLYTPIKDSLNKTSDTTKTKGDVDAIIEYSAKDSAIFDVSNQKLMLYNQGDLKYKEYDLKAARIILYKDSHIMEAYGVPDSVKPGRFMGTPIFLEGSKKYEASNLRYNFVTRKGNISMGSTVIEGGFYLGEKIKKVAEDVFFIQNGRYTTCDKEDPDFYFGSPKMKIMQGDKVIAEPVYLFIDDVPIFALPFGVFPNHSGRSSGLIPPAYGEDATYGRYLSHLGYFWAISDYMDVALQGDYFTRGKINLLSRFRYALRYKYTGTVELGGTRIRLGEATDLDKRSEDDWLINVQHNQTIDPSTNLSANVNILSSKAYYDNSTNNLSTLLQQNAVSNVTLTKFWEGTPNQLSINYSRDQNLQTNEIRQTAPSISFSRSQTYPFRNKNTSLLDLKWYEAISYSYNTQALYLDQKTLKVSGVNDGNFNRNTRGGLRQSVATNAPLKLSQFSLSPFFNYNEIWYSKSVTQHINPADSTLVTTDVKGFKAFRYFNTGISLDTRLIGLFNTRFLGVKGFRHIITPSIVYTFQPDFSKPQWNAYGTYTDITGKQVKYSFYQREVFGGAPGGEVQSIGLNVGNVFEIKVKDTDTTDKKFQILNLTGGVSYNIAADSLKFSELGLSYRTQIGSFLNIGGNASFNVYKYVDGVGRVNRFLLNTDKKLAQLTAFSINLSTTLAGGEGKGLFGQGNVVTAKDTTKKSDSTLTKDTTSTYSNSNEYAGIYGDKPIDFSIPWSIGLNYNYSINKSNPSVIAKFSNISVNINFNLTKNWKFSFAMGYDIFQQQVTAPYITIYRDLHCWEMNFNWVPTGIFRGFRFELKIKAPQLQDVKITKQTNYRGVY